jgi:hypothetical protein
MENNKVLLNGNPDNKKFSYQWAELREDSIILTDYNCFNKEERLIILSKESLEKMLELFDKE